MTVQEAASRLGCSDMTIRRRISARQFPAVKNGRKSMIPRSFVERLLAEAEAGRTVVVDEAVEEWRTAGPDPFVGEVP
jgi:excisionase family DNA binding protein